jgi:hypothetical protein
MNKTSANEQRIDSAEVGVANGDTVRDFGWHAKISRPAILEEISARAKNHPAWQDASRA